VCLRHKEEAYILKTKLPVIAYAEDKWLIMFLRTFGRRRPPIVALVVLICSFVTNLDYDMNEGLQPKVQKTPSLR
jgi:hypothetical protein